MLVYTLASLPFALAALDLQAPELSPAAAAPAQVQEPARIAAAETAQTPAEEAAPLRDPQDEAPSEIIEDEVDAQSLVFAGESDDAVVAQVTAYLEGLTTLRGDFVQNAPSGAVSTGKFWLRRPGQIRFDYDDPSPLRIVATQGNVYVEDKSIDQTDLYPIKKTPLRFLLSKKIELDGARVVSVDRGVESLAVTFASDDEETEGELSVVFAAPDLSLRQWIVRDPQNGMTIVTLKDPVAGERLANTLFRAPDAGGAFINN